MQSVLDRLGGFSQQGSLGNVLGEASTMGSGEGERFDHSTKVPPASPRRECVATFAQLGSLLPVCSIQHSFAMGANGDFSLGPISEQHPQPLFESEVLL